MMSKLFFSGQDTVVVGWWVDRSKAGGASIFFFPLTTILALRYFGTREP